MGRLALASLKFPAPTRGLLGSRMFPKLLKITGVCFYCGNALSRKAVDPSHRLTKDHVFSRRQRAELREKGLKGKCVDACWTCNCTKSDLSLEEFRAVMAIRNGVLGPVAYQFSGEQGEGQGIS